MQMKKVWKWLSESVHSHGIYEEPRLSEEFKKKTGKTAPWGSHSVEQTNKSVGTFKGVEKKIAGGKKDLCSYGYQIAEACEKEFAGTSVSGQFTGRGFAFNAAVNELKRKGI